MKLTHSDYKKILKYYKLTIPKNHKKTLKKAENIIAKKLCSCIKKVEPKFKKEAPAIGICTKSVIGRKGYKRGKFACKKKRTIKLYKGGRRRRTRRKRGGCKSFWNCFKKRRKEKGDYEEKNELLSRKIRTHDTRKLRRRNSSIKNLNILDNVSNCPQRTILGTERPMDDKGRLSPNFDKGTDAHRLYHPDVGYINFLTSKQLEEEDKLQKNMGRRKKTRRKKRRRNKNEGRKSLAPNEINRLKNILNSIINGYNNNNYDLIGKYLIEYDNRTYKENYIENNFNNLIYELAPDNMIRSEYFSFIDDDDINWILQERNLQGCCIISG